MDQIAKITRYSENLRTGKFGFLAHQAGYSLCRVTALPLLETQ